jgi:chaperonin GroEL
VQNSGGVPEVIVEKILQNDSWNYGYNARTKEYGDLVTMGVIDPTLVLTSALRHATSAADNLLSVACAMQEIN